VVFFGFAWSRLLARARSDRLRGFRTTYVPSARPSNCISALVIASRASNSKYPEWVEPPKVGVRSTFRARISITSLGSNNAPMAATLFRLGQWRSTELPRVNAKHVRSRQRYGPHLGYVARFAHRVSDTNADIETSTVVSHRKILRRLVQQLERVVKLFD